ncbi:hypothetical protein [Halobacillus litoralis]|uniref:hypothetical protein n=1 Tax=Halobacillus litoralis TaxID=45668 RepID=UPI001CFE0491|nr:hypothetical protein [Halobacillus litoralis]
MISILRFNSELDKKSSALRGYDLIVYVAGFFKYLLKCGLIKTGTIVKSNPEAVYFDSDIKESERLIV